MESKTCFYCRLPVSAAHAVYFQMGECAVPICVVCDDKVSSMASEEEYSSQD